MIYNAILLLDDDRLFSPATRFRSTLLPLLPLLPLFPLLPRLDRAHCPYFESMDPPSHSVSISSAEVLAERLSGSSSLSPEYARCAEDGRKAVASPLSCGNISHKNGGLLASDQLSLADVLRQWQDDMHIHTAHGVESRYASFGGQCVHFRQDEKRYTCIKYK